MVGIIIHAHLKKGGVAGDITTLGGVEILEACRVYVTLFMSIFPDGRTV